MFRSKSWTSSRMPDQFSARMCESGRTGAPLTMTAAPEGKVLSMEMA